MSKSLMARVVESGAMTALFQPIVDLRTASPVLHSLEGLSRGPRGSNLEAPDILFEFARRKHQEAQLDRAAISAILGEMRRLPEEIHVHVNAHASTIGRDPGFGEFLRKASWSYGIAMDRLTLEIVEHSTAPEEGPFLEALAGIRRTGAAIALDDVGAGTSNFRMILLTRPSMLKADRSLVDGIATDPYQQATLRAIRLLADQVGASVVAEGIENEEDLAMLRRLGVEFGQGYLFSRPLPAEQLSVGPWMMRGAARVRSLELVSAAG